MADPHALLLVAAGTSLGAIAGSFVAAVLTRWPRSESVVLGRSHCDACDVVLAPRDLVPVLSHLLAGGSCRACKAPIDRRHLASEIAAAAIGGFSFAVFPAPMAAATALFGWWLLLLAMLDLEHQWLPDRLTLPLALAGLGLAWAGIGPAFADRLVGLAVGAGALWLLAFGYRTIRGRDGLGGGDPKLLGAIGAWLGWHQLPLVLLGGSLAGLAALIVMRMKGEAVHSALRLPFGTLMVVAAWPLWLLVAGPAI